MTTLTQSELEVKYEANEDQLNKIKNVGRQFVIQCVQKPMTNTKLGSIRHLLWGSQPSIHSLLIKFGKLGEEIAKAIVEAQPSLKLLPSGLLYLGAPGDDRRTDVDLLWVDPSSKTLYYREVKGNVQLDTEKGPAMLEKIAKRVKPYFQTQYPDYDINCAVLNWSVYDRDKVSQKNQCKFADWVPGVPLETFSDFLSLVGFSWEKQDFTNYWLDVGVLVRQHISSHFLEMGYSKEFAMLFILGL